MSMFALLGGGVRVRGWITEQRNIKENHKGTTTKLLMVNLDITPLHYMCVCSIPNYHLFAEPSCRGKGLGLEATQLMMYYGKETIAGMSII